MTDIHWTNYIGMVTGVIGCLWSFLNHRRISNIKSLDLRLELRIKMTDYQTVHEKASAILNSILEKKRENAAATGLLETGGQKQWEEELEADQNKVQKYKFDLFTNLEKMNHKELEEGIAIVHKYTNEIMLILSKYENDISEIKEEANEIGRRRTYANNIS
jgi:hypothetical protein